MKFRDANNFVAPYLSRAGLLGVVLAALAAAGAAAGGPGRAGPVPLPEALERFRRLGPAQRLRLLEKAGGNLALYQVARGVLTVEIVERGTLEAAGTADVVCRVRGRNPASTVATRIKWVVDNGTAVQKGDKLVELDDSGWREELKARAGELAQAEDAVTKALGNRRLVRDENTINVRLLEIALRLAEVRLKRNKDRDLTEELELRVEQARLGLERGKMQAGPLEAVAETALEAARERVGAAVARRDEAQAELARCVLRAPRDGVAIYYVPEQARFGAGAQPVVAQGEPVREGQKLLQIADLSHMEVVLRVHEAMVSHLRKGQRAAVRVDAFPGRVLTGQVKALSGTASELDFFASDVKVYKTVVTIDGPAPGLKPGMSAEVRIVARQTPGPVLQVPLASVLAAGGKRLCFVVTDKGVEEREVVPGLGNARAVEIKSGLEEGDRVLLAPRSLLRRATPGPAAGKEESRGPGPATIRVRSVKPADQEPRRSRVATYGLTSADLTRIAVLPGVRRVVPVRSFWQDARRLARVCPARVVATTPAYADLNRLAVEEGRFLCDEDDVSLRNVAVLGSAVAEELFPAEEPAGRSFVLNKQLYVVVGVLCEQDERAGGPAAREANHSVYLPLRTCNARFGPRVLIRRGGRRTAEAVALSEILVAVRDRGEVSPTADDIRDLLGQAHQVNDWAVQAGDRP
jgi:RND family efflux transporter MFP subunit